MSDKKYGSLVSIVNTSKQTHKALKFLLKQLNKSNIRFAFGIPKNIDFYLLDSDNVCIFAHPTTNMFAAQEDTIYCLTFAPNATIKIINNCNINGEELKDECSEFDINWKSSTLLDLTKGEGGRGGSFIYFAGNGTIVHSSIATYDNSNYHYLEYLFNGNVGALKDQCSYWLATPTKDNENILFTFASEMKIAHLNVCSTSYHAKNEGSDRKVNYSIDVYCEQTHKWVGVCSIIDTNNDEMPCVRCHKIQRIVSKMRINVFKTAQYMAMKEIDIFVVE